MICSVCQEFIHSGGCRHASEYFEIEPKYWDVDSIEDRGNITEERAR